MSDDISGLETDLSQQLQTDGNSNADKSSLQNQAKEFNTIPRAQTKNYYSVIDLSEEFTLQPINEVKADHVATVQSSLAALAGMVAPPSFTVFADMVAPPSFASFADMVAPSSLASFADMVAPSSLASLANEAVQSYNKTIVDQVATVQSSLAALAGIVSPPSFAGFADMVAPSSLAFLADEAVQSYNKIIADQVATVQSSFMGLGAEQFTVSSCSAMIFSLGAADSFDQGLESAFKSYESFKNGNSSSIVSLNLNSSKLLTVKDLNPSQIKVSNTQISPTYPLLKSRKTNDRNKFCPEIQSIVYDQSADYSLNYDAYEFLCDIEVLLRNLIKERIIEPYKNNLSNKIPKDTLDSWRIKKEAEKPNSLENDSDLIEFSDFTDLKKIFEKGNNKDLFKDIFNEEKMKSITSKLQELDPIRKKIAHFRPLTVNEFYRLILYHNDILTNLFK